ncbi:MAG: transcription termination factor NusA [Bacteroides sp.]|nr:MAG: transcription termination factor NusA [Bacteroides sp.]
MDNFNLIDSFKEFKNIKNIDKTYMELLLKDVIKTMILHTYGCNKNFDIILNLEKGDIEIWRTRKVIDNNIKIDPIYEIYLKKVQKIDSSLSIGDDFIDEIILSNFSRRSILIGRKMLSIKMIELEKQNILNEYKNRINEVIVAEITQIRKKEIILLDNQKNELLLPKSEQISFNFLKKGDIIRSVIIDVKMINDKPIIIVSRTNVLLLHKLLELEVPEIFDGLINIKSIVREPGERAKVSVESYDDRIDPIGACVGIKGSRIHGIIKELSNESIDIVQYTNNIQLYIQRSLSPAKISRIQIIDENTANVYVKSDQVALAIGKNGCNIRLAIKLTGYQINIYKDSIENNNVSKNSIVN